MKICIFVDNYFKGGVAKVVNSLITNWPDASDTLVFITNHNNPMLQELDLTCFDSAHVETFNFVSTSGWFSGASPRSSGSWVTAPLNIFRKVLKPWMLINQIIYFQKWFRVAKFDAFLNINGGYPGSITSRAAAIGWSRSELNGRQVMAIHNFSSPSRFGFKRTDQVIDRAVFASVDEIVTVSNACKQSFINRPGMNSCAHTTVVSNGLKSNSRARTKRELKRNSLGLNKDQILVLMLGTYEARKGHEFLIDAFEKFHKLIPTSKLICAGDDSKEQIMILKQVVDNLRLDTADSFLGFQKDCTDLLEACDIVAIPSQEYESFCLVAVDAFMYAKPIVATNVGALPEIIPDQVCGTLCSPEDSNAFARALFEISTDKNLYNRYSEASEARITIYNFETMLLGYLRSVKNL